MGQSHRQDAEKATIVTPNTLEADILEIIDGMVCVPDKDAAIGASAVVWLRGIFTLPKAAGYVVTVGETLYWDIADQEFNSDTANPAVAVAVAGAASDATQVEAQIFQLKVIEAASLTTRLDTAEADIDVLQAGQLAGQSLTKMMTADGTQVAMTVSDTYVNFTADALTLAANAIEDNDTIEWECEVFLDGMNAAYLTTFDLLIGALSLDNVAITTGDTNDWAKLKGTARCTAVGASSTWLIFGGDGCNSDGGSVTRDTPTCATGTGPATTSTVTFTPRIKAATGNAANLATLRNFKIRLNKAA